MNNVCERCNRTFAHRQSLRRHQNERLRMCTPATTFCNNCQKVFTNISTLKKHEKLHCKSRLQSLEDYIDQLQSPGKTAFNLPNQEIESKNIFGNLTTQRKTPQSLNFEDTPNFGTENILQTPIFTSKIDDLQERNNSSYGDSFQALFDSIKFSPEALPAEPKEVIEEKQILTHLDDVLTSWLREVQRLEGTCKSDDVIKNDIFQILSRMLADGLLPEKDYNDLILCVEFDKVGSFWVNGKKYSKTFNGEQESVYGDKKYTWLGSNINPNAIVHEPHNVFRETFWGRIAAVEMYDRYIPDSIKQERIRSLCNSYGITF